MSNPRSKPKYKKADHADGGWETEYEGHRLHAVKRPLASDKNATWAVYEVQGDKRTFVAENRHRDPAVWAAMDEMDLKTPAKPLLNAEHAAVYVKVMTKAYPAALAFEKVNDADGVTIGWTFWQREDRAAGDVRFGWVSTDRRVSPALTGERHQAREGLIAALAAGDGVDVPEVIGAGGVAVEPATAPLEGRIVSHSGTARGALPKDTQHPVVSKALRALGLELEKFHPKKLALALLRDEYDPEDQNTYDAQLARGAWIAADERAEGRIQGFWLEGGQYDRPNDPGLKAQLWILADRLAQHGFQIERVGAWCVTAWHIETMTGQPYEPGEISDMWSVTGQRGEELAVVEAWDYPTAEEEARKVKAVRSLMRVTGGAGFRRLGRNELEERGIRWGKLVVTPVRMVEAVGGGETPELMLPTFTKGSRFLAQDGNVHEVWATTWRDFGEAEPVEMITTPEGREYRASQVIEAPAGLLEVVTDTVKGDTIDERSPINMIDGVQHLTPDGHQDVITAAEKLEGFRRAPEAERSGWLDDAAFTTRWAAAKFRAVTGGRLDELTWQMIARAAVELRATRYHAHREHAFDPSAPRVSLFGDAYEPLEESSPEGHQKVLNAALHWQRYAKDNDDVTSRRLADTAIIAAAGYFAEARQVGSVEDWIRPVLYLAEIHTMNLVEAETYRRATAGH